MPKEAEFTFLEVMVKPLGSEAEEGALTSEKI